MKQILAAITLIGFAASTPLHAAAAGVDADLRATTVPGSRPASGTLDTSDPASLVFHAEGQPAIAIPYAKIMEIHLADKTTLHLGVLPAILVYLIAQPTKHHTLSIAYRDAADATEVVTLELGELSRNDLTLVLESRAKQACLDRGEFGACQPITLPPRAPMVVERSAAAANPAASVSR